MFFFLLFTSFKLIIAGSVHKQVNHIRNRKRKQTSLFWYSESRTSITYRYALLDGSSTRRAVLHSLFFMKLVALCTNHLMRTREKHNRHLFR
ncbi:hypothetical protein HanRHA438_Chr08g0354441 [Helianthus annuus]|nr:hypothetical protein HanRHA438_Chr08g0354441 [Helianthus annuus]